MIKLFSPGIKYYVKRIRKGPFTFVRYGDGEWKKMVGIPLTPMQQVVFADPTACRILRNTVVNCYRDNRYLMASCYPKTINLMGYKAVFKRWLKHNVPEWVKWYHGHVWRNAARDGQLFPLVQAIRAQPLPVVLVGPKSIAKIKDALSVTRHIVTKETRAWYDRERIESQILSFRKPAFYCFSVGSVAKVIIHDLWPQLGRHSYMIDFGAVWAGLCGRRIRHYHKYLTPRLRRRNLHGNV